MNSKNTINVVNAVLLSSIALLTLLVTPVEAAVRCETQYGGGQKCIKTGELQVNKQVWDPSENKWKDNIDLSHAKRFAPLEDIKFRIEVKNVGDETFGKVTVTDTLPNLLFRHSGDLSWEVRDLASGKSEAREFIARFVPADQLPKDMDCVENVVEVRGDRDNAFDRDRAVVCFAKEKGKAAAPARELPKAGPEHWYLILGLSTLAGITGFYMCKAKI